MFFVNGASYEEKKAIAASFLSSYSQLSAEIEGRSYGSGVLKIEPSAAKNISIFTGKRVLGQLAKVTTQIDSMLSKGLIKEAQSIVDKVICASEGIPQEVFEEFCRYADAMRKDRYKGLRRS